MLHNLFGGRILAKTESVNNAHAGVQPKNRQCRNLTKFVTPVA